MANMGEAYSLNELSIGRPKCSIHLFSNREVLRIVCTHKVVTMGENTCLAVEICAV